LYKRVEENLVEFLANVGYIICIFSCVISV